MDLRGAADYPSNEPRSGFWTKTRIIVWIILPTTILFWLLSSACWNPGWAPARDAAASAGLSQLSQAAKAYQLDFDALPSGDGRGSAGLRRALATPGPKRLPYYEFPPEGFDAAGNIRCPVDFERLIYYRYPGLHNPKAFDLWCADSKGRADGINNWGK